MGRAAGPAAVVFVFLFVVSVCVFRSSSWSSAAARASIKTNAVFKPKANIVTPVPRLSPTDNPANLTLDPIAQFQQRWFPWEAAVVANSPRVFVSCAYNKGRSGHELKDVATTFLLATWFGWTPCAQDWWRTKSVKLFGPGLGLGDCRVNRRGRLEPDNALLDSLTGVTAVRVIQYTNTTYDGLDPATILGLRSRVDAAVAHAKSGEVILVYLTKSTRVHMDHAFSWARTQPAHLPGAVFRDVRGALQARLFAQLQSVEGTNHHVDHVGRLGKEVVCNSTGHASQCSLAPTNLSVSSPLEPPASASIVVAIHLRRGDIGAGMAAGEWTSKAFAQRLVNSLHEVLDTCARPLHINIYTERSGADDLKHHPKITGVTKIWAGASWEHDMIAFLNADVLVITNSSMSTWAAQFGRGLVVVPSGNAKHFRFEPRPSHVIPYITALDIPDPWRVRWNCSRSGLVAPDPDSASSLGEPWDGV